LQAGAGRGRPGAATDGSFDGARPVDGAGQVEEVGPLGVVEVQGAGDGAEDVGRRAGECARSSFE
jgi:hypothetical protein